MNKVVDDLWIIIVDKVYFRLDSEYDASSKDGERLGGLVEMEVIPSLKVEENTTVRVTITSKGSFPEPRYVPKYCVESGEAALHCNVQLFKADRTKP